MAAVVAGLADLRRRAEQRARLADVAVALAEVDAVGTEPLGKRHAVVDDERHVRIGADALQRLGEPRELMLVDVLDAQLEGRRDAGLDRGLEPVRKRAADVLRTDQVELRRLRPLGGGKSIGIELGLVHGQAGTFAVDAW